RPSSARPPARQDRAPTLLHGPACDLPLVQAPCVRGALAGKISYAALHDEGEAPVVLHDADVGGRIAIDQQEIGELAGLDQAELVAALHDLAAGARGRLQGLAGSEAEMGDEVLEVAGVGALRVGGEAVVAAQHDADAALAHGVVSAAARLVEPLQAVEHDAAVARI